MPTLLFAYGTLAPQNIALAHSQGWQADAVRGRLFDLGPYPALIDVDDVEAPWIDGFVRSVTLDELAHRLDPYEEVDEGLYRRVTTTTRAGRQVWVYVYAQPLPSEAKALSTRWNGPRVSLGPFPPSR